MLSRRALVTGSAASIAAAWLGGPAEAADAAGRLAALENRTGGTLGVAILDTGTGAVVGHRLDERFPLCSTHKLLSAAFVLARVEAGTDRLDRRIAFGPEVILPHSPVTGPKAGGPGLTLGELCAAAVTVSDNAAANLLLGSFGGPEALTSFVRGLGDSVTRLDRTEPTLNEARPGDPRDTTTPRAMAMLASGLVVGPRLTEASRTRLQGWMVDCQTGLAKIRAGVPAGWPVGDKTGSGGGTRNATNDVAVLWPPGRAPLVVAVYTIDVPGRDAARDRLLAGIGGLAAA